MAARKPAVRKPAAKSAASRRPQAETPLLEWVSAGVGLALTFGLIGVIGWEAMNADNSPPAVTVERLGVTRAAAGYVLEIEVANTGGSPAAQVAVEGELTRPDGETETAQATFDYVPDHSVRKGGLFFAGDPRAGTLRLQAKGYVEP